MEGLNPYRWAAVLMLAIGLDNDFWKPIKAYWKEPGSRKKHDALRSFPT